MSSRRALKDWHRCPQRGLRLTPASHLAILCSPMDTDHSGVQDNDTGLPLNLFSLHTICRYTWQGAALGKTQISEMRLLACPSVVLRFMAWSTPRRCPPKVEGQRGQQLLINKEAQLGRLSSGSGMATHPTLEKTTSHPFTSKERAEMVLSRWSTLLQPGSSAALPIPSG